MTFRGTLRAADAPFCSDSFYIHALRKAASRASGAYLKESTVRGMDGALLHIPIAPKEGEKNLSWTAREALRLTGRTCTRLGCNAPIKATGAALFCSYRCKGLSERNTTKTCNICGCTFSISVGEKQKNFRRKRNCTKCRNKKLPTKS